MQAINSELLEDYITKNPISVSFKSFLKGKSVPKQTRISNMSQAEIIRLISKINSNDNRHLFMRSSSLVTSENMWKNGQLKLFEWFFYFYCYNSDLEVTQLSNKDFQFFQSIFFNQTIPRLKYEVKILTFAKAQMKRFWQEQQINLFTEIVSKYSESENPIEWKQVAYDLYSLSDDLYFRTNSQCRQRWANYLNSEINHSEWTQEEDYTLMKMVHTEEARWTEVARKLNGKRTEHMVKNRYYSLIRKWRKVYRKKGNYQIQRKILDHLEGSATDKGRDLIKSVDLNEGQNISVQELQLNPSQRGILVEIQKYSSSGSEEKRQWTTLKVIEESSIQKQEDNEHQIDLFDCEKVSDYGYQESFQTDIFSSANFNKGYESLLPTSWFLDPFFSQQLCQKNSALTYYNNDKVREAMEDVAQHLGCHAEQVDWILREPQFQRVERFDLEWD